MVCWLTTCGRSTSSGSLAIFAAMPRAPIIRETSGAIIDIVFAGWAGRTEGDHVPCAPMVFGPRPPHPDKRSVALNG